LAAVRRDFVADDVLRFAGVFRAVTDFDFDEDDLVPADLREEVFVDDFDDFGDFDDFDDLEDGFDDFEDDFDEDFDADFEDDFEDDDLRFFGAPPPLSRDLFNAIATACFCAFFLLAGRLLPIAPFLS
jgi:hypothetical protein